MNKKRNIIISIISIILIIFIIIGFTYGFLHSNIYGNTNEKSVTVDTKNSKIEFTDLSSSNTDTLIEPGFIDIKLFTVKNLGNVSTTYNIYLTNVTNNFARPQDLQYTLYRKSGNNTIDITDFSDCTVVTTGQYPSTNSYIKENEILNNQNDIYTYALKIEYVNSIENQDANKGKTFGGKVQIDGEFNNLFNYGTLAYKVFDNALNVTNEEKEDGYAEYSTSPITSPANEISGETESTLSLAEDDYGASYYFRGNVKNNYINFAGMCWRIVRIEGDGSVKLILEDQDTLCEDIDYENGDGNWNIPTTTGGSTLTGNYGYTQYAAGSLTASDGTTTNSEIKYVMDYLNGTTTRAYSVASAFYNFQSSLSIANKNKLKIDNWCINDKGYSQSGSNPNYTYTELSANEMLDKKVSNTTFYYDSFVRLYGEAVKTPTLKCNGTVMNKYGDNTTDMYIGTLTADEIVYAGGKTYSNTPDFYLINDYQKNNELYWWSLSPVNFNNDRDIAVYVSYDGVMYSGYVTSSRVSFRPSVTLKSNIMVSSNSGDGSISHPYEIN